MISSVICSSIRTRSARVRARPSSSMTRPKISSIWRRTSTWLARSSLGSRSWMTRRLDPELDVAERLADGRLAEEALAAPGAGGDSGRAAGCRGGAPGAAPGAAGATPGRALSIRFRRDIAYTPSALASRALISPCEERLALWGRLAGLFARFSVARSCDRGQAEDVLRDLRLAVAEDERHAPVERVHDAPAVADDRVVDLAADRVLDVGDPDPERGVGPVEDQPDLVLG